MSSKSNRSPLLGLPVSPISHKINRALGLTKPSPEPLPPLAPVVSPVTRPETNRAERKKRGRRLTVLTRGSTVPEGQTLLTNEDGIVG